MPFDSYEIGHSFHFVSDTQSDKWWVTFYFDCHNGVKTKNYNQQKCHQIPKIRDQKNSRKTYQNVLKKIIEMYYRNRFKLPKCDHTQIEY